MSEVPLYPLPHLCPPPHREVASWKSPPRAISFTVFGVQGYLAHKKSTHPQNPPRTLGIGLR